MEGSEMELKSAAQKPHLAIRCARAAILLSKMNSSTSRRLQSARDEEERLEGMKKEIECLMVDLTRERMKSRKIKLCGLMELILQVLVVLLASTFLLVFALEFR